MIGGIPAVKVLGNGVFSLLESLEIHLEPSESEHFHCQPLVGVEPSPHSHPPTHEMNHKTDKALSNGERITMTLAISH